MKMHENEGGRAHSDANKILQRHDIDSSLVSFERRIVQAVFTSHIWTISPINILFAKKMFGPKHENARKRGG